MTRYMKVIQQLSEMTEAELHALSQFLFHFALNGNFAVRHACPVRVPALEMPCVQCSLADARRPYIANVLDLIRLELTGRLKGDTAPISVQP